MTLPFSLGELKRQNSIDLIKRQEQYDRWYKKTHTPLYRELAKILTEIIETWAGDDSCWWDTGGDEELFEDVERIIETVNSFQD